jgi:cellulose biosynthesis protein BcsQ/outer membrane murein-binding lipoprotein Lpp
MAFSDIIRFFENLPSRGPEYIIPFLTGVVIFAALWWFFLRHLGPSERLVEQLRSDKRAAEDEARTAKAECTRLGIEKEQLIGKQFVLETEVRQLNEAKATLTSKLEQASKEARWWQREYEQLLSRDELVIRELREEIARQAEQLRGLDAENRSFRQTAEDLTGELERKVEQFHELEEKCRSLEMAFTSLTHEHEQLIDRLRLIRDYDGNLWLRPVMAPVAPFVPLPKRKVPIIAVINVKGGVGKTTIAANLGAALWKEGHRILLIDLDDQAALTALCDMDIVELCRTQCLIDYFFKEAQGDPDSLVRRVRRLPSTDIYLVPANEFLLRYEMQAMVKWILEPEKNDTRFLLRRALHGVELAKDYDFVLLDCPPRLTTTSVNALVACDFVVIPVLLDRTSADRVPLLLGTLHQFRHRLSLDFTVLGIIGNRVYPRAELVERERWVWEDQLPAKCKKVWGGEVYQFATLIKQSSEIAEAANESRFAALHKTMEPVFLALARELKRRICLHEGRQSPAVPQDTR